MEQSSGLAGDAMRRISGVTGAMLSITRHHPPTRRPKTKNGEKRLRALEWHEVHSKNVSLTARHFGVDRSTVYRWRARYDPHHPETLDDRSSRPQRVRQRCWTAEQLAAVQRLRAQYPRWGKDKLVVLVAREGLRLSTSMVGRILSHLRAVGKLIEPLRRISARKRRRLNRPYATRKPKEYTPDAPGDLVQVDTLDVRPEPGIVLKQFTARDVVSRWDVLTLASRATATLATTALDAIQARMPFPVRAIQVDNGSEFMADFEAACQQRGVQLFVLPPHSPKLNGRVERANRTHTEEFYECSTADPTVTALGAELRAWEDVSNTIRPHQALAYQTPAQFLTDWREHQHRKEALSHTY